MEIPIIYEDSDVLVVNKPAGLVVHPDGKTEEETLCGWAVKMYPEMDGVGESLILSDGKEIKRPGIVHRLDRETSGAIVLSKNQDSFLFLKEQFGDRKVKKTYNAFVYGKLKEKEGVIDKPIGRSSSDFRKWSAEAYTRGKGREATTEYKVLEYGKDISFVEAKPLTGRTHQIRVHFKAMNNPIVCDSLYAPKRSCELGFKRLALHARVLSFSLKSGEKLTLEAGLPEDFESALKELKQSV